MLQKHLLPAVLLFVATAAVAQEGSPATARAYLADRFLEADDGEAASLWRWIARVENAPSIRALGADLLDVDVSEIERTPDNLPAPEARAALMRWLATTPDGSVVQQWEYLEGLDYEIPGNLWAAEEHHRRVRARYKESCLDYLPPAGLVGACKSPIE